MGKTVSLENVDSRANRYALDCFCVMMAAFAVGWAMNQLDIFIVDKAIMNAGFAVSLGLFVVCLTVCKFVGLGGEKMKYLLLFFIIAITTVIETMLTYHSVLLSALPIVYAAMYPNAKRMAIYTYLLTVVSIVIIVFAGYWFGLCDANMVLLTRLPLAQYLGENGQFTLNQVNSNPLLTLTLYFVFPRCVICGVFVPVCINISKIIVESRLKEKEMRLLAEVDGMTGLYNRSKYREEISATYRVDEKLAVIFWDVNDLKLINDSYGHEYGDKLILTIADSIKRISSSEDRVYRIGGDEFVMILNGGDEYAVQKKLRQWEESIRGKTVISHVPVTAAYGYACGAGAQLEQLIHKADEMMYKNKRAFHERTQQ